MEWDPSDFQVDGTPSLPSQSPGEEGGSNESFEVAMAEFISRMEPTRPDIIQAAHAHQALRYFGQVLRTAGWQTHAFRRVSFPTDKIDEFWSHSWHGNKWSKILTAFFLYNFMAAATASTFGAMLMMILFSMGFLPDLRLENPTYPSSSWWCTAVGFYLYLLVAIFWRPRKHIFLDVLCIDQQNEDEKVAAIVSMGAFLKCSDTLLVLWDPSYTHRLWCVFEMAAFLHSRPASQKAKLIIRPTFLGPCLVSVPVGLSCVVLAMTFLPSAVLDQLDDEQTVLWPVLGTLVFLAFYTSVATSRAYFRSVEVLQEELSRFVASSTLCWCCSQDHRSVSGEVLACDRRIVLQCITSWFGSVERFEEMVRTEVQRSLADQLSKEIFTFSQVAASAVPLLWHFMDTASEKLHQHGIVIWRGAAREFVRGLGWGLGVLPVAFFVTAQLTHLLRRRRAWRCCDVATNCFILGVCILIFVAALYLEQYCWLFEKNFFPDDDGDVLRFQWDFLPGTSLFAFIFFVLAAMLSMGRRHANCVKPTSVQPEGQTNQSGANLTPANQEAQFARPASPQLPGIEPL